MTASSTGNCYLCGIGLGKTAMKNHLLKVHGEEDGEQCYLLKIEGAYDKDYWLYIDIPVAKSLSDVDGFLRKIWLECCGHLSGFNGAGHSEVGKSRKIGAFSIGDKIAHEYDFGSTTESVITVVSEIKRKPQKAAVRLLSRNSPAKFKCMDCEKEAEYICTECIYDSENPFYCSECGEKHEHDDMLLPVANSPRMGVCGYSGELDTFGFDSDKLLNKR